MSSFDRIDVVYALDTWQTRHDDGPRCPNPEHGKLWPHQSGAYLMCPCGAPGQPCKYREPVPDEFLVRAITESREPLRIEGAIFTEVRT